MEELSRSTRGLTKSWNRRLDTLCDRFRDAWRNGAGESVEAFLETPEAAAAFDEAPPEDRAALLRELATVERKHRRRRGEDPRFEECKRRFPKYAPLFDELLHELAVADESTAGLGVQELAQRIVDAGLMSADELQRFRAKVSASRDGGAADADDGAAALAGALLRSGKVTAYQLRWLAAPTRTPLVLGNYVILRPLGAGGMGEVFQARHRKMDRQVALKVLSSRIAADPSARSRFDQEVRTAAQLSHPNIVTAYDSDEASGILFLVMEYVPGINLSEWMKSRGPLTPPQAVGVVVQAARGLEHAHRAGVIHRDIKPANLMISVEGVVKVLDMGLARTAQPTQDFTEGLTQAGQGMGTLQYMAPEQAVDAKTADARADVYSLGCTLHFLLTGKPPFVRGTDYATLLAHRDDPIPPLTALQPQVGPGLEAVYRKMLAKRREDRYETMTAARLALEKCGVPAETPPSLQAGGAGSGASTSTLRSEQANAETASDGTASWRTAGAARPPSAAEQATTDWTENSRPAPAPGPVRRRPSSRLLVGAAVLLGLLGLVWAAAVVFRVETPDGTIVVEVDQPDADIYVDGNRRVTIRKAGEATPLTVEAAGERHELKVVKEGFAVYVKEFVLKDRDRDTIRVSLVPNPAATAAASHSALAATTGPTATQQSAAQLATAQPAPTPLPPLAVATAPATTGTSATGAQTGTSTNPSGQAPPAATAAVPAADRHAGEERSDNVLNMKLVWCPPGKFLMGSPEADSTGLPDERPQMEVELTRGFWLGKHEVTQGEWKKMMGSEPWKGQTHGQEGANFPATYVNWDDATAFCTKLTQRDAAAKKLAKGWSYRLPSEAEWEYACRAGSITRYCSGDDADALGDHAWHSLNSEKAVHEVGLKRSNAWGLHDMHGNLWEWTGDWYEGKLPGGPDPTGPSSGTQRVNRGGSWAQFATFARSARRFSGLPTYRGFALGFRVVLAPESR